MTVGIPAQLVSGGDHVLHVCARHGEPAAQRKPVKFASHTPPWVYLLIPFGLLPFAIVATVLQKRVKAPAWPFCARCTKLRTGRLLTGTGLAVLAILTVLALAAVLPKDSSYGVPAVLMFVALLFVGLLLAANAAWPLIASGYVSRDGSTVNVRRPDPRFAEQVAAVQQWAAQQWAAQRWAAQQQYPQPQHGQQLYAQPEYRQQQYQHPHYLRQQQPYGPGGTTGPTPRPR